MHAVIAQICTAYCVLMFKWNTESNEDKFVWSKVALAAVFICESA